MGLLSVNVNAKIESLNTSEAKARSGISFPRYFTAKLDPGKTPYDETHWETRTASIGNDKGGTGYPRFHYQTC